MCRCYRLSITRRIRRPRRYGSGIELRLSDGELEFRYGQRFPAYSIRVRSQGAHLVPGEWRHVALVYAGVTAPDPMRAPASWVRIYIDGSEVPTLVLNDGMQLPEAKTDKASPTRFRIGWDNAAGGSALSRTAGRNRGLDAGIERCRNRGSLRSRRFRTRSRGRARGKPPTAEIGWLRTRCFCRRRCRIRRNATGTESQTRRDARACSAKPPP